VPGHKIGVPEIVMGLLESHENIGNNTAEGIQKEIYDTEPV
jgi:hypothetical protein